MKEGSVIPDVWREGGKTEIGPKRMGEGICMGGVQKSNSPGGRRGSLPQQAVKQH